MKTRREMLEEFLAQDPGDSFSRYALALELDKEGRQDDALKELQAVLERDPNYVAVYYQLGRLLAQAGRTDEAREIYRRGIGVAAAARDQRTREELVSALENT
ncbi:MAG TPA: tetratricopeptide repeat protein [Blastocatellia bacterium]|nr:tetratricopeptide repeat protein [Blastocatellia bacterium]